MTQKAQLRLQLFERDGEKCHYCGIKESDFALIWKDFYGGKRRSKLEIDRRDNELGYEIENCVLACAVCNCAKSDKFTYSECKKVGKAIRKIWQQRKNTPKQAAE
jgi:5-methylcytosine-specific restriction endonuclease McrA